MLMTVTSILFETSDLIGQTFHQFINIQSENDFHICLIFTHKPRKHEATLVSTIQGLDKTCDYAAQDDRAAESKASWISQEIT